MKLIGWSTVVCSQETALFKYAATEDCTLVGVRVPLVLAANFQVANFFAQREDGTKTWSVVECEVKTVPAPVGFAMRIPPGIPPAAPSTQTTIEGYSVVLDCFAQHLQKCSLPLDAGDVLALEVYNISCNMQTMHCSFELGSDGIATDGRWWADEHGKLVRPLLFHERHFKLGDLVGSLRVVDPETYDGFDVVSK